MSDERWKRIDRLLQSALGRPEHERDAFVRDACADDEAIRDEVLSLLAHAGSADRFLEPPPEREPLQPGARLGAYEIREQIGEGGMGQVYRARDSRLRRDVALKVLPAATADAERRQRFAREAQAVAALNHPGIVVIHSVEQSGDIHFLTMELVDGAPLNTLIPDGGFSIERLLEMAIPLADAIGAAHNQGILHRDLKPANVMVTRDGRLKVMDFGLAKLMPPVFGDVGQGSLTTMSGTLTEEGRILGTVAYMSPEQAQGRDVDHRSDVFSLGVLLFEMATGQRPFEGESTVAVLAAIVKDAPASVADLRAGLPPDFVRVVRKCLAKDPARRYQSALDVRNDLEEIRAAVQSSAQATPVAPAQARANAWTRPLLMSVAVLGLFGIAHGVWPKEPGAQPVQQAPRLMVQPPSGTRIVDQSAAPRLAISPDGKWVAFHAASSTADRRGLYLHSTDTTESRLIRPGEMNGSPFFSPDSRWLGFWSKDSLWKVRVDGGEPQWLAAVPDEIRGASWGDDGNIVFASSAVGVAGGGGMLYRVPAEGGGVTQVTFPQPDGVRYYFPDVLPGSKAALVMLLPERVIGVVSLQTGVCIRNWIPGSSPRYVSGGFVVFRRTGPSETSAGTLYAAPFDAARLELTGEARPVHEGVQYNPGGSETSAFDVARSTGVLFYTPPQPVVETAELVWLDRNGQHEPLAIERQNYAFPVLDPDGHRVAVQIIKGGQGSLSVYSTVTKAWTDLADGLNAGRSMDWSNGQWVVFSVRGPWGTPELYRVAPTGGAAEPLISRTGASGYDQGPSVRGDDVLFYRQIGGKFELRKVSMKPPSEPAPYISGPFSAWNPRIHPLGKYVAYESNEIEKSGTQILLRPYQAPERYRSIVSSPGTNPEWSRDGRLLYYRRARAIWSVRVIPGAGDDQPSLGKPEQVLDLGKLDDDHFSFTVGASTPDGQRFVAIKRPKPTREENLLIYVPNWLASVAREMKRDP